MSKLTLSDGQGRKVAVLRRCANRKHTLPPKLVFLKIVGDVLATKGKQLVNVQFSLSEALRENGLQPSLVRGLNIHA